MPIPWLHHHHEPLDNLTHSIWWRCVALDEANGGNTIYCLVFWVPIKTKRHISDVPLTVASLRHICAIIMLSYQHLDMARLWGAMGYLSKREETLHILYSKWCHKYWALWGLSKKTITVGVLQAEEAKQLLQIYSQRWGNLDFNPKIKNFL